MLFVIFLNLFLSLFQHFELSQFLHLKCYVCLDNWYLVEANPLTVVELKSTSRYLIEL